MIMSMSTRCRGGQGDSDSKAVGNSYETRTGRVRSRRRELVEQIHAKMELLEEESRLMKKVVLGCVEDRAALMREISQQLCLVEQHLRSSKIRGGSPTDERKNAGLLGVLQQELSPSLVSRDLKVNFDALKT
ncbi:uncharacterized protein [Typha angustifolia]|uniref:uncharacterized protein n=1 Tax=Typha angustifolia TaxID=59011 RepID=UPI003C2EB065